MKQTIKTGLAALLLLLAISCKKENSSVQSSGITSNSATQDLSMDDKVLAGNTVRIGTQVWMTKNLDIGRYRNGDKIPQVKNKTAWAALTTGAWCWYNNDSATGAIYGKLYNGYAVNDPRGLAPEGWHVPSDSEWTALTIFLGGETIAGGKMKETGTAHWLAPNAAATNSSGFTALPGGNRNWHGTFNFIGTTGAWWSSTEGPYSDFLWDRLLRYNRGHIYPTRWYKQSGYSVRCIRD